MIPSWNRLTARIHRVTQRLDGWPRRVAAIGCLLLAMASFVGSGDSAGRGRTRPLWIASRDLPAGASPRPDDVTRVQWPADLVPAAVLTSVGEIVGHPVGAPIGRGEPLTSTRMLDSAVTAGLEPGQVAAPVSLPDRGQRAILHVGSSLDLYATAADAASPVGAETTAASPRGPAKPVVSDVRLLAVLPTGDNAADNRLTVLVAVDRAAAARLATHAGAPMVATLVPPP